MTRSRICDTKFQCLGIEHDSKLIQIEWIIQSRQGPDKVTSLSLSLPVKSGTCHFGQVIVSDINFAIWSPLIFRQLHVICLDPTALRNHGIRSLTPSKRYVRIRTYLHTKSTYIRLLWRYTLNLWNVWQTSIRLRYNAAALTLLNLSTNESQIPAATSKPHDSDTSFRYSLLLTRWQNLPLYLALLSILYIITEVSPHRI